MDNENEYQSIISQKCPYCFRKNECMLLPSQRATLCLGPFEDEEDRLKKIREDNEKNKPKANIDQLVRRNKYEQYQLNRLLFESKSKSSKRNPDESDE